MIPQIKAAKLEPLPVPSLVKSAAVQALGRLAKRMFILRGKRIETRSERDVVAIQRQINATEQRVEDSVNKLYGLSRADMSLVEGALSNSKHTLMKDRGNSRQTGLAFGE